MYIYIYVCVHVGKYVSMYVKMHREIHLHASSRTHTDMNDIGICVHATDAELSGYRCTAILE